MQSRLTPSGYWSAVAGILLLVAVAALLLVESMGVRSSLAFTSAWIVSALSVLAMRVLTGRARPRVMAIPEKSGAAYAAGLEGSPAPRLADIVALLKPRPNVGGTDICVEAGPGMYLRLPEADAIHVVGDVLSLALQQPHVKRVSISQARKPSEDRISVFAEHDPWQAAGFRMLGQKGESCHTVRALGWPRCCSATWFDNGYEYVYQITVRNEIA